MRQIVLFSRCPMPHAPCPMPHAQCPMPDARCPMPHSLVIFLDICKFDTPRRERTGILGSTKPLKLDSLQSLTQRWDSPQALIRVCPTLFAFEASPV
ncbi:hypothetical protein H6G81_30260 [Scytonema hofmannii FACHB-248]|uniref:Uncharacterized protein n=1 Tax=Scytonema hofmannii FACHB-248 TaxID=1842502 RepID=A0ABR8GYS1_9CYAN|nr:MULTISPECIES: hypothetical protein [Nostocales]MBD2608685.1 hypothetical protein [Scytonema hofmannii FACHB-248]